MGLAAALSASAILASIAAQAVPPGQTPPAGQASPVPARPGPTPLEPPPPRAPIAGLRGFESRSRLVYAAQPGRAHELRAAYVFPDRVRWWISAREGATEERRLRYQYGPHVLAVEPSQSASIEYRAEDRDALLAAFELRRALFLYPDGCAWSGSGSVRTATLASGDVLTAKLAGEPARPIEIEYAPRRGETRDSCRAITWAVTGGRAWPATFELWNGATLAWREAVESVDVETRILDSFFIPPDRRGAAGAPVEGVRDLDIPPTCLRRVPLEPGTSWDAARAARAKLAEDWPATGAPALEEFLTFELREDGLPAAIHLRLARVPERAPEGFVILPERLGAATSVRGLSAVTPAVLERVRHRLPAGGEPGPAYARFDGRRPDPDVVVVVPIR
ncbi:MAG: hypothetical protein JNK02_05280 [Planctomycetes bacterium]|nr:hypothetical protein [Planctomycetota bacterium]